MSGTLPSCRCSSGHFYPATCKLMPLKFRLIQATIAVKWLEVSDSTESCDRAGWARSAYISQHAWASRADTKTGRVQHYRKDFAKLFVGLPSAHPHFLAFMAAPKTALRELQRWPPSRWSVSCDMYMRVNGDAKVERGHSRRREDATFFFECRRLHQRRLSK
eukprot:356892-Pleurochrysis_carterae.AAC.1